MRLLTNLRLSNRKVLFAPYKKCLEKIVLSFELTGRTVLRPVTDRKKLTH